MNRYESNANYRRSIKAQNKRNYNAAIAQGMAAFKNLGGNTSKIYLANLPNNDTVPMTEEEMEQAIAELEAEIANGANKTKNGRKFTNLSAEEIRALNAENSEALSAWLEKSIGEMPNAANNAANKTKNGRKFTNLSEEEMGALNAENTAAFSAWLVKTIEEM